jgi:hypothetical protein
VGWATCQACHTTLLLQANVMWVQSPSEAITSTAAIQHSLGISVRPSTHSRSTAIARRMHGAVIPHPDLRPVLRLLSQAALEAALAPAQDLHPAVHSTDSCRTTQLSEGTSHTALQEAALEPQDGLEEAEADLHHQAASAAALEADSAAASDRHLVQAAHQDLPDHRPSCQDPEDQDHQVHQDHPVRQGHQVRSFHLEAVAPSQAALQAAAASHRGSGYRHLPGRLERPTVKASGSGSGLLKAGARSRE